MSDPSTGTPSNTTPDLAPRGTVAAQRCTARTSSGRPCKRWAIVGGNVCPTHGGSAPQVRRAAMRRIQARVLPALDEAYRMAMDPETPAPVRARLLVDLMDRAGLKPTDVHALVTPETAAPDLDDGIRAALAARGLLPGGQGLDGEVLDEDEDADEPEDEDLDDQAD